MNRDAILGVVRHVLTFAGGFAVAKGKIDAPGLEMAVGAVITLVGVAWSAIDKANRGEPKD